MVTLRDVNDHIPTFDERLYEASVVESAMFGERVVIVMADDFDSGRNGQIRYSIPSTSGNTHYCIEDNIILSIRILSSIFY